MPQIRYVKILLYNRKDIDNNNQNNIFQWRSTYITFIEFDIKQFSIYNIHVATKFPLMNFLWIWFSNKYFIDTSVATHYHHHSFWFQFVFAGMSFFVICNYAGENELLPISNLLSLLLVFRWWHVCVCTLLDTIKCYLSGLVAS